MTDAIVGTKAAQWLIGKMEENRMSLRDAATVVRRSTGKDIAHTTISDAINGRGSWETWRLIAKAFKVPERMLLEWAGYLDPMPSKDHLIEQIEDDYNAMSPAARKIAAKLMHSLRE